MFNLARPENYPIMDQDTRQPEIQYTTTVSYLHINSSDRNVTSYPSVNSYRISLPDNYRNVHSIELATCSIANQGSPLNLPFLVLKIDGLNHIQFSNNSIDKAFATLYLKNTTAAHIQPELGVLQRNVLQFKTPLASLNYIELSILQPNGTLFSFGETSGDMTTAYSNSFLLKIITLEKSRQDLHNRAAF